VVALRIAQKGRAEGAVQAFLRRPVQTMFAYDAIIAGVSVLLDSAGLAGWSRVTFFVGLSVPILALVGYPILTFTSLYRSYREANVEEKRQVKWPLWGTMIAVGFKILFGAAAFGVGILVSTRFVEASTWMGVAQTLELLPRLFYLLIPISFAVAILKYRLMNIDVIIKKTVAYGILSGLIIAMYLILVGGLGTMLVSVAGVRNQTMVIASTLVVALVFVPLRNRLQSLVDRNLFRQKYDYPQALRAIAAETLAATDLRSFLMFAAETIQQALQSRSVAIFERRQDDLVTSAKVGLPDSVLGSVRLDANQADAIDRPLNPKRRQLPEQTAAALLRVGTALAVPVRSQGVLQCVLALGSKLSDREFDLEDIEFLSSVADQIAITIDRIRLQRDEEDFEQARAMQQALLPAHVPQIEGIDVSGTWKPAGDVSGDYYDLLAVGDRQLGVCIGDVAGKGMPAALLMSALQAAVRASATVDLSPAALCERVRRVIVPSLAGGRFVTFFYCTIDTAARQVRYCNAGHNPAILVRADGTTSRLDKGGPALSRLFSGTPFQEGQEPLYEGDRIVLFTDGVSEARDTAGNDYGEDGLERVVAANRQVPARELVSTIVDSVSSFSGGRADDDLTLVALAITIPA
jgi:stage II sporulation SpoE-like protein/GAF domain-containing protein